MSTARQRRRRRGPSCQKRDYERSVSHNERMAKQDNLRQRVTMEVARLANVLGMTMAVGEWQGRDLWVFYGWGKKNGLVDYWPLTGRWDVVGRVGGLEPDVRKVLEMAATINRERSK